jgi:dephospho-CoA kinase
VALLIGLTGGIGSGKSVVAKLFAERGAGIIDTDVIAHELTQPGGAAMPAIRAAFGERFIDASGALDRAVMRELVFAQPDAKQRLEAILHPRIGERVSAQVAHLREPYALLVVPLLIESGAYRDAVARVLVVDSSEAMQVSRTMARNQLSEADVHAIMAAQAIRQTRLDAADDVIDNSGDLSALAPQVDKLHTDYLNLAAQAFHADAGRKPAAE